MDFRKTHIFATAALLVAGSASLGLAADTKSATTKNRTSDLSGKWTSPCHKLGVLRHEFAEETFEFGPGKTFSREIKQYSDGMCLSASLMDSRIYQGAYETGNGVSDGAVEINFTIENVEATALGEAALKAFNSDKFCTHTDWKLGERRSVAGLVCDGQTIAAGTQVYDIAKKEGDKLYFGDTSYFRDGTSPKSRPTRLDTGLVFTKAPVASAH